jgi:chromosomal replication initiator protein
MTTLIEYSKMTVAEAQMNKRCYRFEKGNGNTSLERILFEVSKLTWVPIEYLRSKTRQRNVCEARQIYFRRAREMTTNTLYEIGALVNRDHATVMNGIKIVNDVKELRERYKLYFKN